MSPPPIVRHWRTGRYALAAAFILLVAAWLGYVWFITGVFPVTEKYPSGRLKAQGFVRRAGMEVYKRHGHWVTYHENGQKESEGDFDNGEKTGSWTYWNTSGRPVSTQRSIEPTKTELREDN